MYCFVRCSEKPTTDMPSDRRHAACAVVVIGAELELAADGQTGALPIQRTRSIKIRRIR